MKDNFTLDDLPLLIISFCIGVCIILSALCFLPIFKNEEECVSYYLNNKGYILGQCEKYKDKLLNLD